MTGEMIERIDELHARYAVQVLERNAAVRANREYSIQKLDAVRQAFAGSEIVSSAGLLTVATAGSFGRLEACSESDLDDMPVADKGNKATNGQLSSTPG